MRDQVDERFCLVATKFMTMETQEAPGPSVRATDVEEIGKTQSQVGRKISRREDLQGTERLEHIITMERSPKIPQKANTPPVSTNSPVIQKNRIGKPLMWKATNEGARNAQALKKWGQVPPNESERR